MVNVIWIVLPWPLSMKTKSKLSKKVHKVCIVRDCIITHLICAFPRDPFFCLFMIDLKHVLLPCGHGWCDDSNVLHWIMVAMYISPSSMQQFRCRHVRSYYTFGWFAECIHCVWMCVCYMGRTPFCLFGLRHEKTHLHCGTSIIDTLLFPLPTSSSLHHPLLFTYFWKSFLLWIRKWLFITLSNVS